MLQDLRRVGKVYEIQGLMRIRPHPDYVIAKKSDKRLKNCVSVVR